MYHALTPACTTPSHLHVPRPHTFMYHGLTPACTTPLHLHVPRPHTFMYHALTPGCTTPSHLDVPRPNTYMYRGLTPAKHHPTCKAIMSSPSCHPLTACFPCCEPPPPCPPPPPPLQVLWLTSAVPLTWSLATPTRTSGGARLAAPWGSWRGRWRTCRRRGTCCLCGGRWGGGGEGARGGGTAEDLLLPRCSPGHWQMGEDVGRCVQVGGGCVVIGSRPGEGSYPPFPCMELRYTLPSWIPCTAPTQVPCTAPTQIPCTAPAQILILHPPYPCLPACLAAQDTSTSPTQPLPACLPACWLPRTRVPHVASAVWRRA